jgi:hypothetical protein
MEWIVQLLLHGERWVDLEVEVGEMYNMRSDHAGR